MCLKRVCCGLQKADPVSHRGCCPIGKRTGCSNGGGTCFGRASGGGASDNSIRHGVASFERNNRIRRDVSPGNYQAGFVQMLLPRLTERGRLPTAVP